MAELVREIEAVDIPKLKDLMTKVFGDSEWKDIQRLGGMTNHSYKITRNDGEEYLARIPGDGTEEMINRLDERKSTELGCNLEIDSPLLYFGDDGRKFPKRKGDPDYPNHGSSCHELPADQDDGHCPRACLHAYTADSMGNDAGS